MTDSLLKEVDNALKWQRVVQLWQQSGKQIGFLIAVFVIALIALLLYKQQQSAQQMKQSDALLHAIAQAPVSEEAPPANDALDASHFSATALQLAQLLRAGDANQKGASEEAHAALLAAQNAPSGSPLLADYSCALRVLSGDAALAESACTPSSPAHNFSALTLETQALKLLAAQQPNAALALLEAQDNTQHAGATQLSRLDMLRAYVRSRSAATAPAAQETPQEALDAPLPVQQ